MNSVKTPWHIWVVGIVSLLWNAMGAFDYLMTNTQNEAYMASFTPEQLEFFYSFPSWVTAFWAIAVWLGVLGSLLILFRSRYAVEILAISFIAMFITAIHNFLLSDVTLTDVVGPGALYFSAAIFVVAALLVWYVAGQRRKGVLR